MGERGNGSVAVTTPLNLALMKLPKRAERSDPSRLVQTFVDVGPLFTLLSSIDHQILFGRRGTGKTHALKFLADEVRRLDDVAVYIDLRLIGSTGGLYADPTIPITERGTRLLLDTASVIHEALVDHTVAVTDDSVDVLAARALLDRLADAIAEALRVVGTVDTTDASADSASSDSGHALDLSLSVSPSIGIDLTGADHREERHERTVQRHGVEVHRVHFGAMARLLESVVKVLGIRRLWILVDEWNAIPPDLQPLLADLLRRSLFPIPAVTVKIGALEQRSVFRTAVAGGGYLGIEVGADATADVDLDDFMVFRNDAECAKDFFQRLLYKHVAAVLDQEGLAHDTPRAVSQFVQRAFTGPSAFDELVKAGEGVPRDVINIAVMAAARANDDPISVPDVRAAARAWYQRDKEGHLGEDARELLHWIVAEVIGQRQARAFLLADGEDRRHPIIGTLYDARVLHMIRRTITARDHPGVRFNGWSLDYGCYVELISTTGAPRGAFEVGLDDGEQFGEQFVEVPADDYRSIKRAILDLDAFERQRQWGAP